MQNGNGLYTGLGVYAKAEKYYVDTNEAFVPRTIKENIFGTEGFLPPMTVNACAITPFVNEAQYLTLDFVKNDCNFGFFGNTLRLALRSGAFGSVISQADADAKAMASLESQNNQDFANLNGACVLPTFVNVKISRFGDMARNDCNTGYFGQKPLIEIAAGVHGSMISQADADAKAETAWALNNNQAYANLNGACVLPTFVNIAISRLSTMARNNCLVGSVGEKLLIEIAAGVHGSMISQADANANAEAAWSILNTQSNVNANAVCTAYSNGLRSKYFSHPISAVYDESVFISGAVLGAYDEVQIDHVSNFDDIHPALYRMPNLTPDLNYFGLQFNGFLKMPTTGVVRLYLCTTGSDDWAKLFLANNLVLSRTDSNLPDEVFVDFGATENELLLLKLNFIELAGDNLCSLRWSYAGQAKIVVPASAFYKEP